MVTNRIYEYKTIYRNISIDRYDKRYGTIITNLYDNVHGYFYGTKKGDVFVLITSVSSYTRLPLLNDRYVYNVTSVHNICNSLSEIEEHQIDESIYENLNNSTNYNTMYEENRSYDSNIYDNGIYSNEYV